MELIREILFSEIDKKWDLITLFWDLIQMFLHQKLIKLQDRFVSLMVEADFRAQLPEFLGISV